MHINNYITKVLKLTFNKVNVCTFNLLNCVKYLKLMDLLFFFSSIPSLSILIMISSTAAFDGAQTSR